MLTTVLASILGAGFIAVIAGLWRFWRVGRQLEGLGHFLKDWNGEPPRPGFAGRPSFPERMTAQEERAETIEKRTADMNHEMRGEISSRLILLEETAAQLKRNGGTSVADAVHRIKEIVDEIKAATADNQTALTRVDERVTEHRRRGDEAIAELRKYLTDRLNAMEISTAQFEAMRASLHELGIDMDPPS